MQNFKFLTVTAALVVIGNPCRANLHVTTFFKLQERVINPAYRHITIVVKSKIDCVRSLCVNQIERCAVSYNSNNRQCVSSHLNAWLILWSPDTFTDIDKDWMTYITKGSSQSIVQPSVLYLLDATSRGKNLGKKGSPVNLIENGLTEWNGEGPRGSMSHLTYLISGINNRAEIPFAIDGVSYHINFTGAYTIALG